ncbi:hypothetical protein COLO4_16775 [Corchorus olitorius]|uniref:F-box domain-containing protein n=1 Tax=Corchorus olitorius TaxID=93759 RepID=A0A1R3JFL3_9ROSI|nr:hypothetical protein COLO4_16775 [Corchorus olitorius]
MSDFVPKEVVLQILSYLTVDTVIKCTVVCKSWYTLITSSRFINAHLAKTLAKPIISQPILTRRFTESPKKEDYFLHSNSNGSLDTYQTINKCPLKAKSCNLFTRIVGTVNGLICLSDDFFGFTYRITLWNPLVRRSLELPVPNVTSEEVGPFFFALGFGFDAKSNDYKVVKLVYPVGEGTFKEPFHCKGKPPKVEVFSVKEKRWRMVCGKVVKCSFTEIGWTQCFLNGRVHWITYEKKRSTIETSVLLFDMEDEKFMKMKLPESLVEVNPRQLSISVNRGTAGRVFGLTQTGEVLLAAADRSQRGYENFDAFLSCLEATSGDMVLYDPKGRQTTHGVQPKGAIDAFYAGDYIESLVFLNKESGAASYEEKHKSINSESGGSVEPDMEQIWLMMGLCSSNDADEEEREHNSYVRQRILA